MGVDTAYVTRVWEAFSPAHAIAVVRNIAALDWQIRSTAEESGHNRYPDVFGAIWEQIRGEMLAADSAGRSNRLSWLADIAGSQSRRVFSLVRDVLAAPAANGELDDYFWQYEVTHSDVQHMAAPLLRTCAASNLALLPDVLDELWALAQLDPRPPNQDGNHPARIIEDLGNLGDRGSLHKARVIIDAASRWLSEPDPPGAFRTPLFALKALLAKEGMTQDWQPGALQLSPYQISAEKVTTLRAQVRDLLQPIAAGRDLRRAVEAVGLLGEALRAPHGHFSQVIPVNAVLAWEQDDLATVGVLEDIVRAAGEPLVRLTVREAIAWHARRGALPGVRARCLALVEILDNHIEDVLTDLLVGRERETLPPLSKRAAFAAHPEQAEPSSPAALPTGIYESSDSEGQPGESAAELGQGIRAGGQTPSARGPARCPAALGNRRPRTHHPYSHRTTQRNRNCGET